MMLALAIAFLWLGAALMYVAFHPLHLQSATGAPQDVIHSLQSAIGSESNAYSAGS